MSSFRIFLIFLISVITIITTTACSRKAVTAERMTHASLLSSSSLLNAVILIDDTITPLDIQPTAQRTPHARRRKITIDATQRDTVQSADTTTADRQNAVTSGISPQNDGMRSRFMIFSVLFFSFALILSIFAVLLRLLIR